ncbi:MAG: glycosyltransferase family 1 protein [Victivallaceae bacterium]|nr:glycosyltransferase family 1 protein [Victivallaceae bacterium]
MHLLIDLVPSDHGKSGIYVYMRELVAALAKRSDVTFTLLVEPDTAKNFAEHELIIAPRWTMRHALFSMLWHLMILPFFVFFRRKRFDAMLIAAGNRRAMLFYPLPTIAVIHDLAPYHVEGKYDILRTIYQKKLLQWFIGGATRFLAISRSTAKDMVQFWHIPETKIFVDWNGLAILPAPARPKDWAKKHNVQNGKYILYVSRIEHPGKNHLRLIQAYEALPVDLKEQYDLILAGSDWKDAEIVHAYAEKSPDCARIHFAGFVSSEDLPSAYCGAALYIFPSLYEGFGLSLAEAMHYKVACCCSSTSSLGEIGAGAAQLFDPESVPEMTEAMRVVLTDETLRAGLIAAGEVRAREFSWEKHANIILDEYAKIR